MKDVQLAQSLQNQELTPKQREVVEYSGDQMLLKGIAGSGKTTVLLHRALKLVREESNTRIAIFTYNKTLAEYAKSLAQHINPERIHVFTFHSWAMKVLYQMTRRRTNIVRDRDQVIQNAVEQVKKISKHRFFHQQKYMEFLGDEIAWMKGRELIDLISYENTERIGRGSKFRVTMADRAEIFRLYEEYNRLLSKNGMIDYDDIALQVLANVTALPADLMYDHVFVDEGQDLQQAQLRLLKLAARKTMIVAADKGQKIYKTSFTWRDIGLNVTGGRTKVLQNTFRSTRQIIQLAHSLQMNDPLCKQKDEDYIEPKYPDVKGPPPQLLQCGDSLTETKFLVDLVKKFQLENKDRVIGILTRTWRHAYALLRQMREADVQAELVKQDQGDVLSPGVKVTSLHSAKGLEFDVVLVLSLNEGVIPSMDNEEEDEEHFDVERRLLYVAMTRAKHELYMFVSGQPSRFIAEMDRELYSEIKV